VSARVGTGNLNSRKQITSQKLSFVAVPHQIKIKILRHMCSTVLLSQSEGL
jgi:hypothetical protein